MKREARKEAEGWRATAGGDKLGASTGSSRDSYDYRWKRDVWRRAESEYGGKELTDLVYAMRLGDSLGAAPARSSHDSSCSVPGAA